MNVKLKVVHGTLKNQRGADLGFEVRIRGASFIIGSAEDCHMRCPSKAVSPHHCELVVDNGRLSVRDLESETGTFVNDQQVEQERLIEHGDVLRIGRLEFEVVAAKPEGQEPLPQPADPLADNISDFLVHADEEERARRLEDPESRQFQLNVAEVAPEHVPDESPDTKKRQRPPKRPPGKLPPPPPFTADNTAEAAEETLKKIFHKDGGSSGP